MYHFLHYLAQKCQSLEVQLHKAVEFVQKSLENKELGKEQELHFGEVFQVPAPVLLTFQYFLGRQVFCNEVFFTSYIFLPMYYTYFYNGVLHAYILGDVAFTANNMGTVWA